MSNTPQVMNSSDLRNRFGQILDDALRGRATIVERFGRPAGAFVPMEVYEHYLTLMAHDDGYRRQGPGSNGQAEEGSGSRSGPLVADIPTSPAHQSKDA